MKITNEQFEELEHYNRMFRHNAERVRDLCEQERSDIEYGFVLGEMHSHLEDCFISMLELLNNINK